MSWDGIYRAKLHKKVKDETPRGSHPLCKRQGPVRYASSDGGVNCFKCLKRMGAIK